MKIEIFEIENFRKLLRSKFSTEIPMKIFDLKNRDFSISKIFVGRFQNSLIMVLINRFGQNFVQNYVEFNGGGRGSTLQQTRVEWTHFGRLSMPPTYFGRLMSYQ